MRIALVSPYDLTIAGGVGAQVVGLASELSGRGHETEMFGPTTSMRWRANGSVANISLNPRDALRLRQELAAFDVVHIHEPFMPMVGWAALGARAAQVVTFHADPTMRVRRLYQRGARIANRALGIAPVTAVSPVAASAVAAFSSPIIIPNGLPVPQTVSGKVDRSVVFLGRDDPRKGLDVLLGAWPRVHARHPDAHLAVIGDVSRPPMEGVTFFGFATEHDKLQHLGDSDIMVAPQTGGESFGITVAEGMAAGCRLVASDLPAFDFVLGAQGHRFQRGDVEGLTQSLLRALAHVPIAEEREKIRKASERFSWATVTDAYESQYEIARMKSL